ncbi:MAG: 8-amino-7-oxononanoate synthase [Acidobacteriota bacterium]
MLDAFRAALDERRDHDLHRRLDTVHGIDFVTNDTLGLSRHPMVVEGVRRRLAGGGSVGAPASRLLAGHTEAHAGLEARLAAWKGTEAALLLPSGWQANMALLGAVLGPGDRAISDALNHASLIDGLRASRCRKEIVAHRDVEAIVRALRSPRWTGRGSGRTVLVTESLYSMDGTIAPLDVYAELCAEVGASLVVDDAHATGLWGTRGSGLVEHFDVSEQVLAITSTGGKALGVGGAWIAGSQVLVDYLINVARPFIFSTAVPLVTVHALDAALDVVEAEPERRRRVHALADRLRDRLGMHGEGPIVPVLIGGAAEALAAAAALREQGFDIRAVRPPTVADGSSRLRVSIHADHDVATIDRLARALKPLTGARSSGATPVEEPAAVEVLA